MKTIYLNNISVDIHDGPIGISASGGADSAVLLYILMSNHPGPIYVYTCSNKVKNNRNPHYALDVITKCIDLTNNSNVIHRTFFVKEQTYNSLFENLHRLSLVDNINKLYTAVTALPSDEVTSTFKNKVTLVDKRDPNVKRPLYNGPNDYYYSPFFNIDKSVIKMIYDELNLTDTLFPVSRSCESSTVLTGHCGQCWWCEERKWAFGKF